MGPKEEGTFYLNMAKKYKSEDGERSLSQFCREENLSYNKMIHILRTESYRRSSCDYEPSGSDRSASPFPARLVVDDAEPVQEARPQNEAQEAMRPAGTSVAIDVTVGTRYRLRVQGCDAATLGAIITELEKTIC